MKIKTGDQVKIIKGKDSGKTGKVEKVFPKKGKIIVSGLNIYKRHLKSQGQNKPSGIVDITKPINISNITLVCSKCNKPARIGYMIDKSGEKNRICKKCQAII